MEYILSRDVIATIYSWLKAPHSADPTVGDRSAHLAVLENGWAAKHDLEDLCYETDERAERLIRNSDHLDELLKGYRIPYVTRYERPSSRQKEVYGSRYVSASDATNFLVELERLGFEVDPVPLVEALRPKVLREKYVTSSELSILWYKNQRHRSVPVILKVQDKTPADSEVFSTSTAYKITALLDKDGVVALRSDPPLKKARYSADAWARNEINGIHKSVHVANPVEGRKWQETSW